MVFPSSQIFRDNTCELLHFQNEHVTLRLCRKEIELTTEDCTVFNAGTFFLLGFLLDLALADPAGWPHPVRLFGWLSQFWEKRLYKNTLTRGALFWSAVMVSVGVLLLFTVLILSHTPPWIQNIFWGYVCYACLALRGLHLSSSLVESALRTGDLEKARTLLSRIVGRETQELDRDAVRRASVETVAENCSDGVIAPMFFCLLLGPIGMLLYKAVNTLDSMVGYKNTRYAAFGTFSAKMDDLVNAIPARLTALCLLGAAALSGMDWKNGLRIIRRDARKHASPNAGFPEAAVAGVLGVRLGGPAHYHGRLHDKAWLGDADQAVSSKTFDNTIRLLYLSSGIMALLVWAILLLSHSGPLGLAGLLF